MAWTVALKGSMSCCSHQTEKSLQPAAYDLLVLSEVAARQVLAAAPERPVASNFDRLSSKPLMPARLDCGATMFPAPEIEGLGLMGASLECLSVGPRELDTTLSWATSEQSISLLPLPKLLSSVPAL